MNIGQRGGSLRHIFKIRRQFDVRGLCIPLVQIALGYRHALPVFVAVVHRCVLLLVLFLRHRVPHRRFHFLWRRPNLAQVNRFARRIGSERLGRQIQIHSPSQRVSYHQWRRCQIIRAHQRVNAPFKIAVSAQHRDRNHIVFLNRGANRFR